MSGNGDRLRLLVIGDSAAAGVGSESLDESILGYLVNRLSRRWQVDWRLEAQTGATTQTTGPRLERLIEEGYRCDVIVSSLGTNDVTSGLFPGQFIKAQSSYLERMKRELGARVIVVSGIPPIGHFPALPQPLRWFLGSRGRRFDTGLEQLVARNEGYAYLRLFGLCPLAWMASDGFHPGPRVYEVWAEAAEHLISEQIARETSS